MIRFLYIQVILITTSVFLSLDAEAYLSPTDIAVSPDETMLYVVEKTSHQLAYYNIASQTVTQTVIFPDPNLPTGVAVSSDGNTIYVTAGTADGVVHVVDRATGVILQKLPVGHSPVSPTLSSNGHTLYVANRFDNDISVINLGTQQETRITVLREPFAMALTPDGQTLVIANRLPVGPANIMTIAAQVSLMDTTTENVTHVSLPVGSTSVMDIAISPDGQYAYVTHEIGHFNLPTTQLERSWINTAALSILRLTDGTLVNTLILDSIDLGAANPWAVACSRDGQYLCVTHAGTHDISVIDRPALHAKLALQPESQARSYEFLPPLRRRISLAGKGPRSMVVVDDTAYIGEYFSDSLGVVQLAEGVLQPVTTVVLGPVEPMNTLRRGEYLAYNATSSFQYWVSCVSCHGEGFRGDGLNRDHTLDGLGNPKNTKSLLLAHETPPALITGIVPTAEIDVRKTFHGGQLNATFPEADADAVDAYLRSLKPLPSPYLIDGQLSAAAVRGKALFEGSAQCISCHSGPYFTDMQMHDMGDGTPFDTPSLVEIWRTAPYLYDGRAASILDVLAEHAAGPTLTHQQRSDLGAYVLSLGIDY